MAFSSQNPEITVRAEEAAQAPAVGVGVMRRPRAGAAKRAAAAPLTYRPAR
jgi:hypothetical protein